MPAGTWVVPADQEFAALAREVLDVQKYPEIRESPGGPLDTPYDAAGWTLPLPMGVRTIAADHAAHRRGAVEAAGRSGPSSRPNAPLTPYNMSTSADAAPFDSAPGIGFDSDPVGARDRAAGWPDHRQRAVARRQSRPRTTRSRRSIARGAPADRSRIVPGNGAAGGRYVISGLSASAQSELVKALALSAEHAAAPAGVKTAAPAHRAPARQHEHGRGLDALGARSV